jgi:hypothetical protein
MRGRLLYTAIGRAARLITRAGDRAAAMTGMELKRMRLAFLGGAMIALCYMLATEDDD